MNDDMRDDRPDPQPVAAGAAAETEAAEAVGTVPDQDAEAAPLVPAMPDHRDASGASFAAEVELDEAASASGSLTAETGTSAAIESGLNAPETDALQDGGTGTASFQPATSQADMQPQNETDPANAVDEPASDLTLDAAAAQPAGTIEENGAAATPPLAAAVAAPGIHAPPAEQAVRLVEALLFASTDPVSTRAILSALENHDLVPASVEDVATHLRAVLDALCLRYAGRGVVPVEVAGGWQFRTAPDLAPMLTRVLPKPRRLARATMETLAIIAYHQPCTRAEIEDIRGVSLGQNVLDTLIEESLIAPRGRKEVPGRPVLWGTTPDFLRHFGLKSLSDLPRREELLVDMPGEAA